MGQLRKMVQNKTWIRYFLSYFILLTILLLGFFFIIRNQLTRRYLEQLSREAQARLDNFAGQLNDELMFLSQTDASLETNIQLIMSRHNIEGWQNYETYRELKKYASSNRLIDAICYLPKNFDYVISTRYTVLYEGDTFRIRNERGEVLCFDPSPYFDSAVGQLIYLEEEGCGYLIYFPAISSEANHLYFYLLDAKYILERMENMATDAMPYIALVDKEKRIAAGIGSGELAACMDAVLLEDGIYRIDGSASICIRTGIRNEFSMAAVLRDSFLSHQIDDAFTVSYITLLLLGGIGFGLVLLAASAAYLPLHRLAQKFVSEAGAGEDCLERLDNAFEEAAAQNRQLLEELEKYRSSPHYPYEKLEELSRLLQERRFPEAEERLEDMFHMIDSTQEPLLSDLFIRCVLVDMLSILLGCMNTLNLRFKSYDALCRETLYFCRSCPYSEKARAIQENVRLLLDICRQAAGKAIHSGEIREAILESCCHPEFSIYELADRFHVSTAYISSLAKKELGCNFSDYLWSLRMEKAKELLKTTNLSVEEISEAVGYLNPSSLRRKFKQETGLTPSQFRRSAGVQDSRH